MAPPQPLVLGRFTCEDTLGQGVLTETLRGRLTGLAGLVRPFAIKRWRSEGAGLDAARRGRFLDAAREAASFDDARIARVVMIEASADAGGPFVASAFVHGVDLRALTRAAHAGGARPEAAVVAFLGSQIAAALAAVRVPHGGLGPGDVIVTAAGQVRLVDFSVGFAARSRDDDVARWRATAPEVLAGGIPDARSDLFGLGALLAFFATGEPPFVGDTLAALERAAAGGPPPFDGLPERLARSLRALLAPDPAARPLLASLVASELAQAGAATRLVDPRRTLVDLAAAARGGLAPEAGASGAFGTRAVPAAAHAPRPEAPAPGPFFAARAPEAASGTEPLPPLAPAPPGVQTAPVVVVGSGPAAHELSLEGVAEADEIYSSEPTHNDAHVLPPADDVLPSLPEDAMLDVEASPAALPLVDEVLPVTGVELSESELLPADIVDEAMDEVPVASEPLVAIPPVGRPSGAREAALSSTPAETARLAPAGAPRVRRGLLAPVVVAVALAAGGLYVWQTSSAPVPGGQPLARAVPRPTPQRSPRPPAPAAPVASPPAAEPEAAEGEAAPPSKTARVTPPAAVAQAAEAAPPSKTARVTAPAASREAGEPVGVRAAGINSTPPGAAVWIDGVMRGVTPIRGAIEGEGAHHVVLIAAGRLIVKKTVAAGAGLDVVLAEAPAPGNGPAGIKVRCKTEGRYPVLIDGKETGMMCPSDRLGVSAGEHVVGLYDASEDKLRTVTQTFEAGDKSTRVYFRY